MILDSDSLWLEPLAVESIAPNAYIESKSPTEGLLLRLLQQHCPR